MKKNERIFVVLLLVISMCIWFFFAFFRKKSNYIQVVDQEGKIILKVKLIIDGDYLLQGKQGNAYLQVKEGKYRLHNVDCPDKRCEDIGWVNSSAYVPIICLPNGLLVELSHE